MTKGGRDTVVVVVTVVTVCWVAGPKLNWPTVECGGGMVKVFVVVVVVWSLSRPRAGLSGGMSSVGDAGAVDSTASGLYGTSVRSPSPKWWLASILLHYHAQLRERERDTPQLTSSGRVTPGYCSM